MKAGPPHFSSSQCKAVVAITCIAPWSKAQRPPFIQFLIMDSSRVGHIPLHLSKSQKGLDWMQMGIHLTPTLSPFIVILLFPRAEYHMIPFSKNVSYDSYLALIWGTTMIPLWCTKKPNCCTRGFWWISNTTSRKCLATNEIFRWEWVIRLK